MKRHIRLKERLLSAKRIHTPSAQYRESRPSLEFKDYYEETSEIGTINTELSIKSLNKILFLGGSFIENVYVESKSRIASFFEKILNQKGYDFQVVNAGVSGATTLNLFNLLLNKFILDRPKALFFFIPTNDGFCLNLKGGLWNTMESYSNLYNIAFHSQLEPLNFESKIEDISHLYSILFKVCDLYGIDLYICASPVIEEITDFYLVNQERQQVLNKNRHLVVDAILGLCKENEVKYIDLRPIFKDKKEWFFDDVHSNSVGSRKIATELFDSLWGYGFFKDLPLNPAVIYRPYLLVDHLVLDKKIFWSDYISLENLGIGYSAILSFDLKCGIGVTGNNALFCVDFDGLHHSFDSCGLIQSPSVGNYQYLMTKEKIDCNLHHKFHIPIHTSKIRVGFRLWESTGSIEINNAHLFLRKIAVKS